MGLTDTKIKTAKPREKLYKLADAHGLYVAVLPTGVKTFRWKYRLQGGKEKTISLGLYPDVSLSLARDRHYQGRKMLAKGIDPMAERKAEKAKEQRQDTTFKAIAALWLEHWKEGKSLRHVDTTRRRIKANIQPALREMQIAEIQAPHVVAMVRAIEARGVSIPAKMALETTGQIFRYAILEGYATRNPAVDIKPSDVLKPRQKCNHKRVDAKELPALLRAIETLPPIQMLATRLIALTFVRTAELLGARWEEIDFESRRWNIPKERMKRTKHPTPHIVPLSTQALDVLRQLQGITGNVEMLFPGEHGNRQMAPDTIRRALKVIGYDDRMTGHGWRGVFSTLMHEHGFDHQQIELQLGHSKRDAVSAAYNWAQYLPQRADMMQWYADHLTELQRGKVIPFREIAN